MSTKPHALWPFSPIVATLVLLNTVTVSQASQEGIVDLSGNVFVEGNQKNDGAATARLGALVPGAK